MTTESTVLASFVVELLGSNPEFAAALYAALDKSGLAEQDHKCDEQVEKASKKASKKAGKKDKKAKKAKKAWYSEFDAPTTTLEIEDDVVVVTVAYGHSKEWHDNLRAAGFRWDRKERNWKAFLDDEKRAKTAARNNEIDAQTAGMTPAQKREYWAAKRAARTA